jgi:hypothetical protein
MAILDKNRKWSGQQKYFAKLITLSDGQILTIDFCVLIVGRCRCRLRCRASKSHGARARYWHTLTIPIFSWSPLVHVVCRSILNLSYYTVYTHVYSCTSLRYCLFAQKWQVVFVDPLPSKMRTEGNFPARFFRRKSIQCSTLYRLTSSFFALLNLFRHAFLMAVCHARGGMVGCMGRISHTNLKNRMVISRIATSKNHIELLVPVRSETGFAILSKFWYRYDLRQRRNRKFLVDNQGCLSKQTVSYSI